MTSTNESEIRELRRKVDAVVTDAVITSITAKEENEGSPFVMDTADITNKIVALISDLQREARLSELQRIMKGQKTIRSYIIADGGEEQIVTYEFANTEIQDRINELKGNGK